MDEIKIENTEKTEIAAEVTPINDTLEVVVADTVAMKDVGPGGPAK